MNCPKCNCNDLTRDGKGHNNTQHYKCKACGYWFSEEIVNKCKILIFDIENAPLEVYCWNRRLWNVNINPEQIIKEWFMICWSAKWLNSPKVLDDCLTPKEAKNRDDKRIVKKLWGLFDEADMIVAHNGKKFDIPMTNTRFITHKLKPPKPYRIIDTKEQASKYFVFTYNKLDYLGQVFGVGRKQDTDFQLWIDCVAGQKKALKTMLDYNIQDVLLLEEVYLKLRPYMKSHPNLNLFQPEDGCANCGSLNIKVAGYYTTQTRRYRSFQCDDCGAYSREAAKTKISIAR